VNLLIGVNNGESNMFALDILLDPTKLQDIDAVWDEFYGPIYLREREVIFLLFMFYSEVKPKMLLETGL